MEDFEAVLARLHESYAQREKELALSREQIASLVTKLAEDESEAQSRISDLEIKLAAANVVFDNLIKDHSTIQEELTFVKIEVDLQLKALIVRLLETTDEVVAQYSKAEALVKSTFDLKIKFRRAKEQLHKYKKKGWSFYRQLTFTSWGLDAGFGAGYIGGFKTFREWVKKPENFSKVETITPEDFLPFLLFSKPTSKPTEGLLRAF